MLVEERGLREGLAGLSFSFGDLRQSYFSCKQPKLLPEIKKKSVLEREESESEPRVGREAYVSWGTRGCVFAFLFLLGFFLHSVAFFFSVDRPSLLGHVHVKNGYPTLCIPIYPHNTYCWERRVYIFSQKWFWHPAWDRSSPAELHVGRGKPTKKNICALQVDGHGKFSGNRFLAKQVNLCLTFPSFGIVFYYLLLLGEIFEASLNFLI